MTPEQEDAFEVCLYYNIDYTNEATQIILKAFYSLRQVGFDMPLNYFANLMSMATSDNIPFAECLLRTVL